MTKQKRKKSKKEAARQAFRRKKRNKALRKWGTISAITLFVVVGIAYALFVRMATIAQAGTLRVAKTEHNFGFVPVQGGIVDVEIPLVNIGEGTLTISGMKSSCGCTRASVINGGKEGPTYGMAGQDSNPKDWHTRIKSGEQAVIKIYYNPATHPDLRGPVTRVVTIYSDDPANPKQEVRIEVNQIG